MTPSILLKRDTFGEVRRITANDTDMIMRDIAPSRLPARWLARRLLRREAQALAWLDGLDGVPELLESGPSSLARRYIDGLPLQEARPGDPVFFREALKLLRELHRRGVVHNDLAKEPNILVREDGRPAFVDFQLAGISRSRGRLFRTAAYDDLRHLLKHKRTYCPQALTARQRRILRTPSLPSRLWMRSGKPVYLFITRRLLGWADREGARDRGRVG